MMTQATALKVCFLLSLFCVGTIAFGGVGNVEELKESEPVSGALVAKKSHGGVRGRKLQSGGRPTCKRSRQRCRRSGRCCSSAEVCKKVPRVINKQGVTKVQEFCVPPDFSGVLAPRKFQRWTVRDLITTSGGHPSAVGRSGDGITEFGFREPGQPHGNTPGAVKRGFEAGMRMVQVPAALTKDGMAVTETFDRFRFTDGSIRCMRDLTLKEIHEIRGQDYVAPLEAILKAAKQYSFKSKSPDEPSGLVQISFANGTPLCDPDDVDDEKLVMAIYKAMKKTNMVGQVLIEAYSPLTLHRFKQMDPRIMVALGGNALQFVPLEQIPAILQTEPEVIDVDDAVLGPAVDLTWVSVTQQAGGLSARLPSYGADPGQIVTLAATNGFNVVNLDTGLLRQNPTQAGALIAAMQGVGITVETFVFGSQTMVLIDQTQWDQFVGLGVSLIMLSDVALGDSNQADWP